MKSALLIPILKKKLPIISFCHKLAWAIAALFLLALPSTLFSQVSKGATEESDLWPLIATQLEGRKGGDASSGFIFLLVKGKCGKDAGCLLGDYAWITNKLERRFQLPDAIAVCEEMVKVARKADNPAIEADAHLNLYRFHDALGHSQQAVEQMELAEDLFTELGDQEALIRMKMDELERSLNHRPPEEVLPKMEAVLAEASANGDAENALLFHILLIGHTISAGKYEETEKHIVAIEAAPISDPVRQPEYKYLIFSALGRADLALAKGDTTKALAFYQKSLLHCEAEPSRWLEIQTLQSIAKLKIEGQNFTAAKHLLEQAEAKAQELNLDDLLAANFKLKARLAEAEGRFADALEFTKKGQFHDALFKQRGNGFDIQRHLLKKQKEKLTTEKAEKENQLLATETKVRSFFFLIIGALLAIGALTWGFLRQRKKVKSLLQKNRLIQAKLASEKADAVQIFSNGNRAQDDDPEVSGNDEQWLRAFEEYVTKNLSNSTLTIAEVAKNFAMSESSLLRQVKRLTGVTPQKHIMELRLNTSIKILEAGDSKSISQVASEVGYTGVRSFSRSFKKKFGKLPSAAINS